MVRPLCFRIPLRLIFFFISPPYYQDNVSWPGGILTPFQKTSLFLNVPL
jgi:hypothetical protein